MTEHEEVGKTDTPMQGSREGASVVFRSFFLRWFPDFFSFAGLFVTDKRSAKNITAESFFLLWRKRGDYYSDENARAFLFTSIRNNCLDYLRYRQQHPDAHEYAGSSQEIRPAAFLPVPILQELLDFADSVASGQ